MKRIALLFVFVPLAALAQVIGEPVAAPVPGTQDLVQTESVLLKIIATVIGLLTPFLVALVAKGVQWLHESGKSNRLAFAGGVVGDLLLAFLYKAKAELVPDLQKALADGVLDQTERALLKKKLIELVLRDAPGDVLKVVQNTLGPAFLGWLDGQAEKVIDSMATPSPASP